MTIDEIIKLAREADRWATNQTSDTYEWNVLRDERFAALVRNAALEEAAGVCENTLAQHYMKQVIPTNDEALRETFGARIVG